MTPIPYTIPTLKQRCAPFQQTGQCYELDNPVTQCLRNETASWRAIANNPVFAVLNIPSRYRLYNTSPFDKMPLDAQRINSPGSLPMSSITVADRPYVVTSYTLPAGYDGVVNNTLNKFAPQTGTDFQDGSGWLTWIIQVNNYILIGYNNITITEGSAANFGPTQHGGGIRLKSNDTITYLVKASATGIASLDPAGIVVCGFQGWQYVNY